MTSKQRAYAIVIAVTISGVCIFGQSVEHWTLRAFFGIVGAGSAAFVNGLTKSPRDAAISDAAAGSPPLPDDVTGTRTTTTIEATVDAKNQPQ